jgi:hypothetical protein
MEEEKKAEGPSGVSPKLILQKRFIGEITKEVLIVT